MTLINLLTQAGSVKLHPQGTLSNQRYDELKSAQKMLKNYMKGSDKRIDIYDALSVPKDKFVYTKQKDSVFIEVTDLIDGTTNTAEFCDKEGKEPVLRQIFNFISKNENPFRKSPLEEMIDVTKRKYEVFVKNNRANIVEKINDICVF